ncbi:hypothetical protein EK904_012634 [Melospiza melodia maxima]|nr:hypothetical protein EK904_012634 [Melospiza melodia maxima]
MLKEVLWNWSENDMLDETCQATLYCRGQNVYDKLKQKKKKKNENFMSCKRFGSSSEHSDICFPSRCEV